MKITRENVETLRRGQILHHVFLKNSDGTPARARINGKVQLWKTRPDDFKIPMKHGLYQYFYITPDNSKEWIIPED